MKPALLWRFVFPGPDTKIQFFFHTHMTLINKVFQVVATAKAQGHVPAQVHESHVKAKASHITVKAVHKDKCLILVLKHRPCKVKSKSKH